MKKKIFRYDGVLLLESGEVLEQPEIAYHIYGEKTAGGKPVIWVCHALTANSDVFDWWPRFFGEGALFNPDDYTIICANVLGSCYGSSSSLSANPKTGEAYFHDFPLITIRDMVQAHELLRLHLGIAKIDLCIGGSMGGQQVLEWAIWRPELFVSIALLATNAQHSAWGQAFNETQRMAIETDPSWAFRKADAGLKGLETARAIAMLSYRHYRTYEATQTDESESLKAYKAGSYQRYQGQKLRKRFDAFAYYRLSQAMDSHHVGRGRGGVKKALGLINAKALIVGIDTDVLFPVSEQEFLARHIPDARLEVINSLYGHDGFLIETQKLTELFKTFI